MTPYRERHLTSEYFGRIHTTREDQADDQADTEPRPAPDTTPDPKLDTHPLDNLARKELVAIADQHGIPNYGTKAQLLERLKDRGVT